MKKETCEFVDFSDDFAKFSAQMKKDYTILIPNMLPWHFDILNHVMLTEGYNTEILKSEGRAVIDEGLKRVHNDTCYPALCVIGQYVTALKSGKYDLNKTAVLITQTGGGCRASNYIPLIRKALKSEFPTVPVLSLNFSGLEKGNGFDMTVSILQRLAYGILYADTIMTVYNQVKPYETQKGSTDEVRKICTKKIIDSLDNGKFKDLKGLHKFIFEQFNSVSVEKCSKIKVGIVGEIYVKYSPLGNNRLEEFLLSEGCEPVVPSLLDFVLYCCVNNLNDRKLYGRKTKGYLVFKFAYEWLRLKQKKVIELFKKYSTFMPMHEFNHLRSLADKVINQGVKMGEGWLIPAEMCAFCESGVENVVCAQPFGCLPNHIVGKGVSRTVRNLYPKANVVPIDYDPSATKVNQDNRIKLMIATAKENMKN